MPFFKKNADLIFLLIISIATIYLWSPILDFVLQFEGYMYLIPDDTPFISKFISNIFLYSTYFNLQGLFLGDIITRAFGVNMKPYFAFELGSIFFTNIVFFFFARTLLKSSFAAFLASIIFASNFFALADIHRPNLYAGVFLERLPFNIPLLLVSFIFLHKYFEKNRFRLYVVSVLLYSCAIFISHFSIFLTFPFFMYPFFSRLYNSPRLKNLISALLLTLPYVLIMLFFVSKGANAPTADRSFLEFLLNPQSNRYPEAIARQLVYISQLPNVLRSLFYQGDPFSLSTPRELTSFIIPTILIYVIGLVFLYLKRKEARVILLTISGSTIAILLTNFFMTERLSVFDSSGTSRYFFIPSILISLYWAFLLTTTFSKKYLIPIGIVIVFFGINAIAFRNYFATVLLSTKKTEAVIKYITQNMANFPKESLIIAGPSEDFGTYDTGFFTYHLGRDKQITFKTEDIAYGDWRIQASSSAHVLKIHYEKACDCVKKEILK